MFGVSDTIKITDLAIYIANFMRTHHATADPAYNTRYQLGLVKAIKSYSKDNVKIGEEEFCNIMVFLYIYI